jgi:phage shock protein A
MNVMTRLSQIFKARANKAMARMEDPRETLDYFYQRQLEELTRRLRVLKDQRDVRERIEVALEGLQRQRAVLEQNSDERGRVDILERRITDLSKQYEKALEREKQIARDSEALRDLVDSFRTHKDMLKADYQLATQLTEGSTSPDPSSNGKRQDEKVDDENILKIAQLLDLLSPDVMYTGEPHNQDE